MWPAVSWFDYLVSNVPNVKEYVKAIHVYGLFATIVSVLSWHHTALSIRNKISKNNSVSWMPKVDDLLICLIIFTTIVGWYLFSVGWQNTGLHAIVTGSGDAKQAREDSLKLLTNDTVRYAYSMGRASISYILGYILAVDLVRSLKRHNYPRAAIVLMAYFVVLISVMLPGARSPAAKLVLTTIFTYYLSTGFKLNPIKVFLIVALSLFGPSMISLLRENQPITPSNISHYYFDIVDRTAGRSVQDNIWMTSYVQTHGHFGNSGIPLVARFTDDEPVNVFNIVGLHFVPNASKSISANTAFPTVNYACYGSNAIWLSLVLTFLMDGILLAHLGLPRRLLIPCCGICAIISLNFAMTMYTTVFITHGLIPTIAVCYFLHFINQVLRPPKHALKQPAPVT